MKRALLTLTLLAAAACGGADSSSSKGTLGTTGTPADGAATPKALAAAVREVRCGCKIDSIKHCGNYVAVDGQWLEITNPADHGLGKMAWCSATEKVEAEVAGETDAKGVRVTTLTIQ